MMTGDAPDAMIHDIEMGDKEGGDDEDKEDLEDRVADWKILLMIPKQNLMQ